MKLLCWIGLHDWIAEHYTFNEEEEFFKVYGKLPKLIVHCCRCHKQRIVG